MFSWMIKEGPRHGPELNQHQKWLPLLTENYKGNTEPAPTLFPSICSPQTAQAGLTATPTANTQSNTRTAPRRATLTVGRSGEPPWSLLDPGSPQEEQESTLKKPEFMGFMISHPPSAWRTQTSWKIQVRKPWMGSLRGPKVPVQRRLLRLPPSSPTSSTSTPIPPT